MKQTNKQTQLNQKPSEILNLLYRFRFLSRQQIQTLLGHKHHSRILNWLNELLEQKYILKFYEKSFVKDPAVYCLDKLGRKYLKDVGKVDIKPLSRAWRNPKYSSNFRSHCLFLVDIYISLLKLASKSELVIQFHTKTDLYGMEHLITPKPDAYFSLEDKDKDTKRYFLDIFDDIPPVALRKRVKQYLEYYNSDEWQDNTGKSFPEIILICPNPRIKSHLYHFIKNKLSDDEPAFYLAVKDVVASKGLTRETLQRVQLDE
ncbi:MAG: replication-relaxation family protein [Patescibacteria group bacterium]